MASSDEEGEIMPECVTDYHFVDYKQKLVSFAILPLQWSKDEIPDGLKEQIFLRGTVDNGLQKIFKQAIAWKFELSYVHPEILVLSKGKNWIKLQRPRKSFEFIVRKTLITVHFLHVVKKNPGASGESIWNYLQKSFCSYEVKPNENDLLDHLPLISEAAKRDRDLEKSKYLLNFLTEKPGKNIVSCEDIRTTKKLDFIVEEDDYDEDVECDEQEDGLFDHVCAICDNGGELLCCEGRCMRSFHATKDVGEDSYCDSLGFSHVQVDAIQTFLCKNCLYQRHQCFVCGMLGSSDKSIAAEVFPCVSATCGHFYHPGCVAKLLHPWNEAQAKELQNNIFAGESFTCPAHKCFFCKQGENKAIHELQFAMCRRCPKAYHRKCLPSNIPFESNFDKNILQRAWDDLVPNRILMYCRDHKMDKVLGTPERTHIIFPNVEVKTKKRISELLSSKVRDVEKKRVIVSEKFVTEKTAVKMPKQVGKLYSAVNDGDSTKKNEKKSRGQGFDAKRRKITDLMSKSLNSNIKSAAVHCSKPATAEESKLSWSSMLNVGSCLVKSPVRPKQQNMSCSKIENTKSAKPVLKKGNRSQPLVDAEMEKRIATLMENSTSSFNLEEFMEKLKMPSTHAYISKNALDKTITLGKVEGSVKAVRTALQKLEAGCSIEDAKAVCEPQILNQIMRWKRKLKVYLAPFLHGLRYTSFGRHFTKVDKLKEIVDRLHPYVQNGDMIVDFCCGANDFSCLMKEKLDKMGKRCSFRNYDLIQPKNDFCFEKRDWMSTCVKELPAGSQLIMGLNPPFGVNASLANKFINKALEFKPKLLILIVPKETKRLDEKEAGYDLIWEDDRILSGKSFYLPGSVDVHNKQLEQWNLNAPPLYLWSRPDWTVKHKAIAQECGHFFMELEQMHFEVNVKTSAVNYLMEENHDCYGDFSNLVNTYGDLSSILDDVPEDNDETEPEGTKIVPDKQKESLPPHDENSEQWTNRNYRKEQLNDNLNAMQSEGVQLRHQTQTSSVQGQLDVGRPSETDEMCIDMELSSPINSPFNCTDLQSLFEDKPYETLDTPEMKARGEDLMDLQPSSSRHDLEFEIEYGGGTQTGNHIHRERKSNLMSEETFLSGTNNGTNLGVNCWPHNLGNQGPVYINNTRSCLAPYGLQQVYNSLSQGSIMPNQDSEFHQLGSFPSAPYGQHPGTAVNNASIHTPTGCFDTKTSNIRPPW